MGNKDSASVPRCWQCLHRMGIDFMITGRGMSLRGERKEADEGEEE